MFSEYTLMCKILVGVIQVNNLTMTSPISLSVQLKLLLQLACCLSVLQLKWLINQY